MGSKAWMKQIEAIEDVEEFLGGDSSSLESSEKEFERDNKDWVEQLKVWVKAIKRVQKNEEFLVDSSEESSEKSSEESSEEGEDDVVTVEALKKTVAQLKLYLKKNNVDYKDY